MQQSNKFLIFRVSAMIDCHLLSKIECKRKVLQVLLLPFKKQDGEQLRLR